MGTRRIALLGVVALVTAGGVGAAVGRDRSDQSGQPDRLAFSIEALPTPSTTPPPTTTTTAPPRTASLVFTGDVLLHQRVNALAAANADGDPSRDHDYRPLLEPIAGLVADADWAVCHMEVNLSADGTRLSPYPQFRAPGQIAADLAELGYDSCTTASNHTLDHGPDGVFETLDVLDAAGLHATGSARSSREADRRRWVDVEGIRLAHLSYTYWFNGFELPSDMPWLSQEIDADRVLVDAAEARAAGAEYVVVSLHWGDQYVTAPNPQQRELAPILAASPDIDLIIGHHAHVVQPIERIGDTWVVYGLGNLLADYSDPVRRDELLVRVDLTESEAGFTTDLTAVPLYVDRATLVVHPSEIARRPSGLTETLNASLDASLARVEDVLGTR